MAQDPLGLTDSAVGLSVPEPQIDLSNIGADLDFLNSRPEIQRLFLSKADPDFAASRPEIQDQFLTSITSPIPTNDLGAGERLRYSLPTNSADLIATIEQDFGPGTARETPQGIAFRRSTKDRFQLIDEPGFTFGDILDFGGEIPELVAGGIGGAIGLTGGTAFGAGFGGAPGAVAGGALGTAAGRAGRQLLSDVFGVVRAEGVDAATDILVSGVMGGGAELGGVFLAKAAGKLLKPFAKKIPDDVKEEIMYLEELFDKPEFIEEARKAGFTELGLTPDQITENGFLDFVVSFTANSPIGGGRLRSLKKVTMEALQEHGNGMMAQFGNEVPRAQLGKIVVDLIDGSFKEARGPAIGLRNQVIKEAKIPVTRPVASQFKAGPDFTLQQKSAFGDIPTSPAATVTEQVGIPVDVRPLKKAIQGSIRSSKSAKGIGGAAAGDDLVKKVAALDDEISFVDALSLRTRFRTVADEFSVVNKKAPAIGIANNLSRLMKTQVKESLAKFTPDLLPIFNKSDVLFAQAERRFNNRALRSLIAKGSPELLSPATRKFAEESAEAAAERIAKEAVGAPELIADALLEKGGVSLARKLNLILDNDPVAKGKVQSYIINRVMSEGFDKEGMLVGTKLLGALQGRGPSELGGFGADTLKAFLGKETYDGTIQFAKALALAQSKGPAPGSFAATLIQIGAISKILAFSFDPASASVLIAPFGASRLLASKGGRQWLAQGFKIPRKGEAAIASANAFFNRGVALNTGLDIIAQDFIKEALSNEEPAPVTSVESPDGSTVTVRRR